MISVRNRAHWSAVALLIVATAWSPRAQRFAADESSIRKAALDLQGSPTAATMPGGSPGPGWAGRHPVILGTLIGAGAVGALAAASRGNGNPGIVGAWVLGGAGAGALGGSIASTIQQSHLRYERNGTQTDALAVQRIVAKLGTGAGVIVTADSARQTRGRIQAVGPDGFDMIPDRQVASINVAYSSVRGIRSKPAGIGKKAGIAAGIAGGIIVSWLACYGAGGCGGVS